jgi:hypothetical protein
LCARKITNVFHCLELSISHFSLKLFKTTEKWGTLITTFDVTTSNYFLFLFFKFLLLASIFKIFHLGFAFTEAGVNRSSTNKVVSCHFSSDGKILASAGHDKRVFIAVICSCT